MSNHPVGRIRPPRPGASPDQADLKAVRGIGPKVEALLKRAGIADLGQLARTPVNELSAALGELHGKFDPDRIVRERWLSQAAALAALPAPAEPDRPDVDLPVRHSFTVEVRMSLADRGIVSSRAVHVQTGDEETWNGWRPDRLIAFVEDRSRPRTGTPAPARLSPREDAAATPVLGTKPDAGAEAATGDRETRPLAVRAYATVQASGLARADGGDGAFRATLAFDPSSLNLGADEPARVSAKVFALHLATGQSVLVGVYEAEVDPRGHVQVDIPCELPGHDPLGVSAVVRVLAGRGDERRPAEGLADARLVVSKISKPDAFFLASTQSYRTGTRRNGHHFK